MLDPAVSAAIKKYGLFKWACLEYPYMVFGTVTALVGIGLGVWAANEDTKKNIKTRYFLRYTVMRPDDPRLKRTVVYEEDGTPINDYVPK